MHKKKELIKIKYLQIGIFVTSIALIVGGIYRDEVRTVLIKAINICLECIGVG